MMFAVCGLEGYHVVAFEGLYNASLPPVPCPVSHLASSSGVLSICVRKWATSHNVIELASRLETKQHEYWSCPAGQRGAAILH